MPPTRPKARPSSPSPAKSTVSAQLAEVIRSRGLTAYAVARAAGIDPGIVSRWLTGRRDMKLSTLDAIAHALRLRLVETAGARRGRGPDAPSAVYLVEVPPRE